MQANHKFDFFDFYFKRIYETKICCLLYMLKSNQETVRERDTDGDDLFGYIVVFDICS